MKIAWWVFLLLLSYLNQIKSATIKTWLGDEPVCEGEDIGCEYFDMIRIGESVPCMEGLRIQCALQQYLPKFNEENYVKSIITNQTDQFFLVQLDFGELPADTERICRIPGLIRKYFPFANMIVIYRLTEIVCLNGIRISDIFDYHGWKFNSLYKQDFEKFDFLVVTSEHIDVTRVSRQPDHGINIQSVKYSSVLSKFRTNFIIVDVHSAKSPPSEVIIKSIKNYTSFYNIEDDKFPAIFLAYYDDKISKDFYRNMKIIQISINKNLYEPLDYKLLKSNFLTGFSLFAIQGILYIDETNVDMAVDKEFVYCNDVGALFISGKSKSCKEPKNLGQVIPGKASLKTLYFRKINDD